MVERFHRRGQLRRRHREVDSDATTLRDQRRIGGVESRLDSLKPAALAFTYRRYPDDTHGLTPEPSLVDGLRFAFEPVALTKLPIAQLRPGSDSAAVISAVRETEQRYARGAHSLGLPDKLPEPVLNQLGYNVLGGLKLPNVAVWIFRRNADLYPESANVYDSLGDGLLAQGDTTAAKTQFKRATDVAARTGDPILEASRQKLEALEKAATQAGKPKPD